MWKWIACLFVAFLPASGLAEPVRVFAAASLQGVLEDVAKAHDIQLVVSYGGSGKMARQIAAGAPADVVILADRRWMDWLQDQPNRSFSAPVSIAGNRLVLIGAPGMTPVKSLQELPDEGRIAIGQRDAVPAGRYAKAWLTEEGLWQTLSPRLIETDNVRAALAMVAGRAVPFGVVYASDALAESRVTVLVQAKADQHPPIRYLAASLTDQGEVFLRQLTSLSAKEIFRTHGFESLLE